jgi:NAD(P)-dependent dehydrogenase (short-subunit alcohol dehydrogenase family)
MLLEGRTAIVSGIGPGMGRDISLALAREGADVALGARRESHLVPVAEEIEALGRRAVWVPTNITDPDACRQLAETAADELGHVDILVNNAFRTDTGTFLDSDLEVWRKSMEVNYFGTLQMTKAAVPHLMAGGNGRIIMINTMSTQRVEPGYGAYAGAKGALATVTRSLAQELGPFGIRVNGIHPGYIWGPNVEWYFNHLAEERGVDPQQVYDEVAAETALGYLADSAELAGTVVYLASDLSRPVTGQSINVSCGTWMQ